MHFVGIYRNLRSRTRLLIAGLVLSIALCIFLIFCFCAIYQNQNTGFRKVQSSFHLINTAEHIYFCFLQAETCVTHNPDSLGCQEHITPLYEKIQKDLDALEHLIAFRSAQGANLRTLRRLIRERRNLILKDTGTRHQPGLPVFNQVKAASGRPDMQYADQVRRILERIKDEEYRLMEDDENRNTGRQRLFCFITLLGGSGMMILILVTFGLLLKDEQDSREREKRLTELNFHKDKFFSIVSHDLRGPASNMLKLSEFLTEEDITAEDRKIITGHLHTSARGLHKLLENLLSWARLQMGRVEVNPTPVNLHQITRESVAQVADVAAGKNIAITNAVPTDAFAYADEQMCNSVLRNLLQNAIKFTHPSGSVRIDARQTGKSVELAVSDTGVGMTSEMLDRLFNLGTHFTSKGTANEQGSGLGLILCQELVQKNNGTISVTSQPGKGTTFTVTLPTA